MIGIPRMSRSSAGGGGAHDRLVDAADAARTGAKAPDIIATFRISITPSDETGSANFLRRENREQSEQPVAAGRLEVGIGRKRLDFSASDEIVTGIVTDLEVLDLAGLRTFLLILGIAVVVAEIVVVGGDRTEHVVPNDLDRDFGIVSVDQWERLSGDEADDRALVLRETDLRRIFFGRIFVGWRPIDALGGDDLHRHPALDFVVHARSHEVLNFGCVFWSDEITRFNLRVAWRTERTNCEQRQGHHGRRNP